MLCAQGACQSGEETKISVFTHLSVKLKNTVVKDNPWDAGFDTKQCFWFLDRWLVLGNIVHTVVA